MRIHNLIPKLENRKILRLWHQAQESQWSAQAIGWDKPKRLTGKASIDGLGRVLSPILMSEQSAFNSAAALLPLVGRRGETESQYYLTTWLVDEARHAELFARMFRRLDREPLSARRFPHAYLFQASVMADDVAVWLAGLLVSELLAKHMMTAFRDVDVDPCLSDIAERILKDEARHIGFNRIYSEDRLARLKQQDPAAAEAFAAELRGRLAIVVGKVPDLVLGMKDELTDLGFRVDDIIEGVRSEADNRMEQTIRAGLTNGKAAAEQFEHAEELGA